MNIQRHRIVVRSTIMIGWWFYLAIVSCCSSWTVVANAYYINEIHYDNDSYDTGEFIEVAHTGSIAGFSIVLYNGNDLAVYSIETAPTFTSSADSNGIFYSVFEYPTNGIQNGDPDGIALVAPDDTVVEFLSYGGTFTAVDGPAAGWTSYDIGITEPSDTPIGQSLQLMDGWWDGPLDNTKGAANYAVTPVVPTIPLPSTSLPYINEFHYDNDSYDTGEFIEVAHTGSIDGFSIVLYNGNDLAVYSIETAPTFTSSADSNGIFYSVFEYPTNGIQNGDPDGIALVAPDDTVVEFLSYGGTFTAVDGPAAGMTSYDIGITEPSDTPIGQSLQLMDGWWDGPLDNTKGAANYAVTPVVPTIPLPSTSLPYINEFHYDNDSYDTGEFIEVAHTGSAAAFSIVLYNGNDLAAYSIATTPTFTSPADSYGIYYSVYEYPTNGIQNGDPDGIALVAPDNTVIQFLSYGGSFTAIDGPAAGLTSYDIGITEPSDTPIGQSLQVIDGWWVGPLPNTKGAANYAGTAETAPPVTPRTAAPVASPLAQPITPPTAAPVAPPIAQPIAPTTVAPVSPLTMAPVVSPVTLPITAMTVAPVVSPVTLPITAMTVAPVVSPVTLPITAMTVAPVVSPVTLPITAMTVAPVASPMTLPTTVAPVAASTVAPVASPVTLPITPTAFIPDAPPSAGPVALSPITLISAAPVAPPETAPITSPTVTAPITSPVAPPVTPPVTATVTPPDMAPVAPPVTMTPITGQISPPVAAPIPSPVAPQVMAPITAPATQPITSPTTAPVSPSVTAPITAPVTPPDATPVAPPATVIVTPPAASPITAPATPTVAAPLASPVAPPVTAPIVVPVMAPVTTPVTAPTSEPVSLPVPVPTPVGAAPTTVPVTAPVPAPDKAPVNAPTKTPTTNPSNAPVTVAPTKAPTRRGCTLFGFSFFCTPRVECPSNSPVSVAPTSAPMRRRCDLFGFGIFCPPRDECPSNTPINIVAPTNAPVRRRCGLFGFTFFCPRRDECGFFRRLLNRGSCK